MTDDVRLERSNRKANEAAARMRSEPDGKYVWAGNRWITNPDSEPERSDTCERWNAISVEGMPELIGDADVREVVAASDYDRVVEELGRQKDAVDDWEKQYDRVVEERDKAIRNWGNALDREQLKEARAALEGEKDA